MNQKKGQISASGWAFALEHADLIKRIATRGWVDGRYGVDDFHRDLILEVAEKAHGFSPEQGAVSTWIHYRMRHLREARLRKLNRRGHLNPTRRVQVESVLQDEPSYTPAAEGWGSHRRIEVAVTLSTIFHGSSLRDQEMMLSHLEGLSHHEVKEVLGVTPQTRNHRLRGLRSTFGG